MSQQVISQECPICMEIIDGHNNRVVTECGHTFHCSCLMQNASHNGFGCPYCRFKLAEETEDNDLEDDDEEWVDDDENEEFSIFGEDALTSFRMFHQRINGEEVEEESETLSTTSDSSAVEEESLLIPNVTYVAEKLLARGITFEDLVKNILFLEHSNFGAYYGNYERRSSQVYGQFRAIITQYVPPQEVDTSDTTEAITLSLNEPISIIQNTNIEPESVVLPLIAESKTIAEHKHREFLIN